MVETATKAQTSGLSMLDITYDLLTRLTDDELNAVQTVARAFIVNNRDYHSDERTESFVPFKAQSEEQLLKRIDHSLKQIEEGNYQDAEEVEEELLAGIK